MSWPQDERPRERLLSRGPQALTDAELVAILVRVGFQGTNAVELGRQLLKRFGSLRAMAEAPLAALLDVKGLKGAKAAQLAAAMEIARLGFLARWAGTHPVKKHDAGRSIPWRAIARTGRRTLPRIVPQPEQPTA